MKSIGVAFFVLTFIASAYAATVGEFVEAEPPPGLEIGDATFGYVTVPERHARPDGPTIRLAVAVGKSRSEHPAPDPLLLLPGGPGSSAMEASLPDLASELGDFLLASRDVVIIELRGTRYSEPSLVATELHDAQLDVISKNLDGEATMRVLLEGVRASHDRFVREGVDLGAYNHVECAADVDMVMTALGYKTFNVFGGSAGTILAQHIIRDYPERLRSVILSSVAPLGLNFEAEMVMNATETLNRIFERYAMDPNRAAALPNLAERFAGLIHALNEEPVTLAPAEGEERPPIVLTGDRFAQWLFHFMYSSPQTAYVIGKALRGDYSPVAAHPGVFLPMPTFSNGFAFSASCSEYADYSWDDLRVEGPLAPFSKATALSWFGPGFLLEACDIWDVELLPKRARKAISSDIPTLILAGEFDQVTPPRYAEFLGAAFSRAYVYTFKGVAHSPSDAGLCPLTMAMEFLDDPTSAPDSTCMEAMRMEFVAE